MQKSSLGEIEFQTEVCYWLLSGTEEVRSWITWLGSTHYVFWRHPGPPATWVLRHPQRTWYWSVLVSPCPPCHFSEKSRPGCSKGVGSVHTALAPLACELYCPKGPTLRMGPTLRRDPTSALPVLKCLIFLEQGVPHFCVPHFHFSLGPTNRVAGPGVPVKC